MREIGAFRYRRHWWTVHLASQRELRAAIQGRKNYTYYGCCDPGGHRILLYARLGPWERRLAFYHEVVEMLNSEHGLGLLHKTIETLGDELGALLTFELPRKRK